MPLLRTYRVHVRPDRVREYEAFERDEGVPMVASMPGCVRAGFGRVAEAKEPTFVFFSVWKTRDDLERARATPTWKRVVGKLEALGLTQGADISEHWEILALQEARSEPARVRAG
jgi:quinol monooxygenase YgiN